MLLLVAFASFMHDNGQHFYLVMPKEGSANCPLYLIAILA